MIHIYTGPGKGKTTAAFGLALRAIGAGKKVATVQFMKSTYTSEVAAVRKYRLPIKIFAFGAGFYKILGDKKPKKEHIRAAKKGLAKARGILESTKFDLIILDEINVAVDLGLIKIDEVVDIIALNKKAELILTGRNAHPKLIKIADLVTVMQKKKHYFDKGIKARKGIEY